MNTLTVCDNEPMATLACICFRSRTRLGLWVILRYYFFMGIRNGQFLSMGIEV